MKIKLSEFAKMNEADRNRALAELADAAMKPRTEEQQRRFNEISERMRCHYDDLPNEVYATYVNWDRIVE